MSAADIDAICLTAPTACGKTDLAMRLAREFPLEIVSMDSAMVYRGMDIGTAKPSLVEQRDAPHHLVDILDPREPYSAGKFVADATAAIRAIRSRGHLPLIVGGTMLYLKALQGGLARLPRADSAVRDSLDAEARERGWAALHRRLAEIDPGAARRIGPNDRQRIQRALEVFLLTGRALSELQARGAGEHAALRTLALIPDDRAALSARIAERFDAMLAAGFLEEVAALHGRGDLDSETPSMRSVGYRQLWQHLDGRMDLSTAREKGIIATRQLAKRQLTWLRSGLADTVLPAGAESSYRRIAREVGRRLVQ